MEKILSIILVFMMLFLLTACIRSVDSNESTQSENTSDSGNAAPENPVAAEIPSVQPEEASRTDTVSNKKSSVEISDSVQDVKIKLSFRNEEVIATMYDNPTSRDLLEQLPLTITFEDYVGLEKIGYPPNALTTEGAPSGTDPEMGDLALYAPWGNLVIYYGDNNYANGIVILGHIESGVEKFAEMDQDFKVTIEKLD